MLEINGEKREFEPNQTIHTLLEALGINGIQVVVEHNGMIPQRSRWVDICLEPGDRIEIVRFMGGG